MLGATTALILRAPAVVTAQASIAALRNLGTEADVEVGFAGPHPVQDAGKLVRHRDDRAQNARSLGDPQAPRPQCRSFPNPQQKARSRLA